MSATSILGFGGADTCAQSKFEAFSTQIENWLGNNFVYVPQRQLRIERFFRILERQLLAKAELSQLFRLAGASSVEPNAGGIDVVWPSATPWRVVVSDLDLIPAGRDEPAFAELVNEASASYVVVVPLHLFEHIDQDDVRRAADIQRRNKLAKRRSGGDFTADDAFVEGLKIRVLRAFQRALEDSPTARLLKSMGMPMTPATDDELLSDGPSLGQDEEHFLSALDADLHSHWQAVAQ